MFLKFCKALYILLCPAIWYCPYDHLSFDTKKENNKKVVINEIIFIFKSQERTYFIKETDDAIVLVKAKKNYTDWPISNV